MDICIHRYINIDVYTYTCTHACTHHFRIAALRLRAVRRPAVYAWSWHWRSAPRRTRRARPRRRRRPRRCTGRRQRPPVLPRLPRGRSSRRRRGCCRRCRRRRRQAVAVGAQKQEESAQVAHEGLEELDDAVELVGRQAELLKHHRAYCTRVGFEAVQKGCKGAYGPMGTYSDAYGYV